MHASQTKGFWRSFAAWRSVIAMVMVQELDQKFRGSRIGTFLTFAEPVLVVLLAILIRGVFRNRLPDFGDSIAVFYSSGILPFYVFARVAARARGARYDVARRLPRVSSTDYVVASAAIETVVILSVMVVWFFAMWMYGLSEAVPHDMVNCLLPLLFLLMFGLGVGLIVSAISRRAPLVGILFQRLSRGLLFVSGAFYVADLMPKFLRDYLVWNPILHGIEWFRLGLYGRYPVHTLDRGYLIACAIGVLFLGAIAHRATIRHVRGNA